MERNALLLYLQNVRDLEVARYCLQIRYQKEQRAHKNRQASLQKKEYWKEPNEPTGLNADDWACAVVAIILFGIGFSIGKSSDAVVQGVLLTIKIFVLLIAAIMGIIAFIKFAGYFHEVAEFEKKRDHTIAHNKEEDERVIRNQEEILRQTSNWNARSNWFQQEHKKLNTLLDDFYNMNILPVQFRTLPAVCYIYDYMSTSRESLTTALFDQHMEDGIRRIETKLDAIVSSLEDMVYETRCLRQNSERIISQNQQMMDSLQQTESNAQEAACYAQLSANYSKANAYFSLANYLKRS